METIGMDVQKTIEEAKDAMTVRRVYGDPDEKNGVTVDPSARARAGRRGHGRRRRRRPPRSRVASWVRDRFRDRCETRGRVRRQRRRCELAILAVDVNKVILGGQIVAILALLVARSIAKSRASRRS